MIAKRPTLETSVDAFIRRGREGIFEARLWPTRRLAEARGIRNALGESDGTTGQFGVGQQFIAGIEEALASTPLRSVCNVLRLERGPDIAIPKVDETDVLGYIADENTATTEQDVTIGLSAVNPINFCSGLVRVASELAQDSPTFASDLGRILGARVGRTANSFFCAGGGGREPTGLITQVAAGVTAASATAVTIDELLAAIAVIPETHLNSPSCKWMMSSSVWLACRRLKNGAGNYLWKESGCGDWGVVLNDHLPSIAANQKAIFFGNWAAVRIIDIGDVRLRIGDERYAVGDQILYAAYLRSDISVGDPSAITCIQQAS